MTLLRRSPGDEPGTLRDTAKIVAILQSAVNTEAIIGVLESCAVLSCRVGRIDTRALSGLAIADTASMYTLIGTRPTGEQSQPLQYATLKEVMQRLQDLIEADECEIAHGEAEERGAIMFVRYTVIPAHAPPYDSPHVPVVPNGALTTPSLRLVR